MSAPESRAVHTCGTCGKKAYPTKARAKTAARAKHPSEHMSAYRCPAGDGWHIGHLAPDVIRGKADRQRLYGRA